MKTMNIGQPIAVVSDRNVVQGRISVESQARLRGCLRVQLVAVVRIECRARELQSGRRQRLKDALLEYLDMV
jgi:hypothetical protein